MTDTAKLVSIDLRADFGFFKKPDTNEGVLPSYNMLHKPALLGILGAIIGLRGYERKGDLPEYYQRLRDLPVGIEPLDNHDKGNFQKTIVKYTNTVGYANADGNLIVEEMMLIRPAYRCYLLLDLANSDQAKLYEYLREGKAEYVPYLGKNEYQAWWLDGEGNPTFKEYAFGEGKEGEEAFKINTTIKKSIIGGALKPNLARNDPRSGYSRTQRTAKMGTFSYFEKLPVGFNEELFQYELEDYAFTDFKLTSTTSDDHVYFLAEALAYVQLT
jgi:CRISPR-associated protein Cas5h